MKSETMPQAVVFRLLTDILKYEKSFFIVITEKTVALASPATMPYIEYTGLKQLPPSDSIAYIR